jgi:hypothetical protein
MSQLKGVFSWRLLAAVAGLFLLSLLAPLTWHNGSQRPEQHLGGRDNHASLPAPRADSDPHIEAIIVLTGGHEPVSAIDGAARPQMARVGPLVADNIDLDPSITQTPLLPAKASAETLEHPASPIATEVSQPAIGPLDQPPAAAIQPEPAPPPELPPTKAWPYAAGLIEELNVLAATASESAGWAQHVTSEAQALARLETLSDPSAAAIVNRLDRLADEGKQLALSLPAGNQRSDLLRAGYAIVRRVVVWSQVHELAASGDAELAPVIDRQDWESALAEVDRRLIDTGAAANWRRYLLIDEAREQFDSPACLPGQQRQLARDILHRMHSTQLSQDQDRFLQEPPFARWVEQLESRAAETPDLIAVLAAIEEHERGGLAEEARALAEQYDQLRWSPDDGLRKLAETINAYYRNANVRVALSAELVNRMIPRTKQLYEPVQDTIQGAWVEGDSHTSTRLRLVLVPDRSRWNIGLEAQGEVASNTSSSKGPAVFYQNGISFFRARKRVTVDRRGIRLQNAEAAANANNNLDEFETDFDGIPLFGYLARAIARNQYHSTQPAAKQEVEGKIVWRAASQLDREVAEKLDRSKRDFQAKMIDPLRKLNLEPTAVDMETTAERLIARYRVAGRDQVSAHTPRPQAPGDSLLSVQIHQTALNNVLEHLNLQGQRIELRQLYKDMSARFSREPVRVPDDLPEDVYVTFADDDPVRIDCQDGRVRLQIRLKELVQEGTKNRWQNFTVRGYYKPDADQLDANLERDGVIELIGDRLRLGDRLALSGIFGKVLSRNRKLSLVNKQIAQAPELQDQQVTQFVIHDGWIGVALGPKTPGRTAAMQPRPDLRTRTE